MRAVHTHHRRASHALEFHYPKSGAEIFWGLVVVPFILLCGMLAVLIFRHGATPLSFGGVSLSSLGIAAALTLMRLVVSYAIAIAIALPLAVLATHSRTAQKILLPIFDVLQSVPILAFFPILVVFFLGLGFENGAAVLILVLTMIWSIVFAAIGGAGLIPRDIIYAAEVFGVRGFAYIRRILLPALVPQIIVGSILAFAAGWNIIIVAEVIRTYLPADSTTPNLMGLGSMMVEAAASGDTGRFLAALATTVLIIALVNIFIWQKLLHYAQRFKFDQ
ncbi:MAG: ABC transporter permease subunit [Minisyncoccia bacterium]